MKTRIVGLACAVLLTSAVNSALADPIVITGGSIAEDFFSSGSISLQSRAFSFTGFPTGDAVVLRIPGGDGTEPPPKLGDVVDLTATVTGPFCEYRTGFPCGPIVELNLKLMAAPLLVTPTVLKSTQGYGSFAFVRNRPFTMTGTVGTQAVVGAGLFNVAYDDGADYFFSSPSSSPTPEPTSLLLLGTGIAALAGRRVTRRQSRTRDR